VMLPATLLSWTEAWHAIGVPLANHLWQSTLFACVAGLLTLALKKNRAQARYWLWLAASVKFLVPFSLVIDLGQRLAKPRAAAIVQPGFTFVVQQISQPFAPVNAGHFAAPVASGLMAMAARILPTALFLLWFGGFAALLLAWCGRWRRVRAAKHGAVAVDSGREFDAHARLSRRKEFARPIQLFLSAAPLEPGIVGIVRPVLLLPAGISERLSDAQLEAIVAHELCHVRRRDNLAAAIHMLVEGVFWFHPLVWWIGARMVDERERACDEEVLRLGSEPQDYAEGILKVCEFYLESPLVCAAGVTGSNLKKRIEEIMRSGTPRKLDFGKKLLLAAAGVAAIAVPVAIGFANQPAAQAQSATLAPATADGVSIRPHAADDMLSFVGPTPGGWHFTGFTVKQLIGSAYGLQDFQVTGGPAWLATERYDVVVKTDAAPHAPVPSLDNPLPPGVSPRLQSFLTDEFGLVFHRETKELPGYAVTIGKDGPKMTEVAVSHQPPNDFQLAQVRPAGGAPPVPGPVAAPASVPSGGMWIRMSKEGDSDEGQLKANGVGMDALARLLSTAVGSAVTNQTGLNGTYAFSLSWDAGAPNGGAPGRPLSPAGIASLSTAISQQLGLELKSQTGPVEMLIVDKAEQIAGNQAANPAAAN
jgi:bla regulator protein blaR1